MSSTMKAWIVVISIVVIIAVLGSFLTNGYGFFKTAPTPAPVIDQAAEIQAAVANDLPAVVNAELTRREQAAVAAAKKLAKAKTDSIAAAKAAREARELAAMPARVRKLEKELAALKAAAKSAPAPTSATEEINIAPALAKKAAAGAPTSNMTAAAPAAPIAAPVAGSTVGTAAKTFPVKVESDQAFDKFGLTVNSWSEWENGETVYLSPGDYGVNAAAGKLWAYDKNSIAMNKPNFTLSVNGIVMADPGVDNTVGGANTWFRLNPDGSITPLQ